MTTNLMPTNYKMKMEYKEMKIEVAGDKKFVEEKFYQLVTAVNKLARHGGQSSEATLNGKPVEVADIFPRPEEEHSTMLDAGVAPDGSDDASQRSQKKVERLPRDEGNTFLEYLYDKNPNSQVDTVLTMVMYLEKERNLDEISVRDIHDYYNQTHTDVPKNLSVSLQQNVNKGFLSRTGNRKDGVRYCLTDEGLNYVDNNYTTEQ